MNRRVQQGNVLLEQGHSSLPRPVPYMNSGMMRVTGLVPAAAALKRDHASPLLSSPLFPSFSLSLSLSPPLSLSLSPSPSFSLSLSPSLSLSLSHSLSL